MKALVYTDTQKSEIQDVELPVADEGQSVIELEFCGICGSDMHAWHGHDDAFRRWYWGMKRWVSLPPAHSRESVSPSTRL